MADLPNISLSLHAQTDVGMVRSGNEDNFLILDLTTGDSWTASEPDNRKLASISQGYYGSLLAVSDGMGGALAGEVASRLAVETVRDRMLQLQAHKVYSQLPFPERLRVAIEEANLLINGESITNPEHKGLGATLTAAGIQGNRVYFGQVGDSRAYLIRQNKIIRITKDQSLVQQLIDAGQITEEEAETHSYRNVILQALGAHGNVNVEVNSLKLHQGDTLVLCSDGLSGKVRADEIARLIQAANEMGKACDGLIALANERGGEDNITVVIVQLSGSGLSAPIGDPIEPEGLARLPATPTELSWEEAPNTEPLGGGVPTEKLNAPTAKPTEPLTTAPPSVFTPPAIDKPRSQPLRDRPSNPEVRERTGPVTSVFSIGQFSEDEKVTAAFEGPEEAKTPSNQTGAPTSESRPAPSSTVETKPIRSETVDQNPLKRRSRLSNFFLVTLAMLGIAAVGLGGVWYFNLQEAKRKQEVEAQEQRRKELEQNERKQLLIDNLKDQIEITERDFRAAKWPKNKEKWERLSNELEKLHEKFDKIKSRPATLVSEIEEDCREIEKTLHKLQDDIRDLQGLIPDNRNAIYPVSC